MLDKLNNLNPVVALAPFKVALGNHYEKIVNDVKAMLGNLKDRDFVAKQSGWKASARFQLKSKDGYTVQLPENNPATLLLCFGMRLNELADNGGFEIDASIPKNCETWVNARIATDKVAA